MMSAKNHLSLIISGIVLCSLFLTACVSTTIGDVSYAGGGLTVSVTHTGEPSDGYIQVTVYQIRENVQEETTVRYAPLALRQGENSVTVPATLEPGQYKLYIYLIQNGERKAATIRDLMVT